MLLEEAREGRVRSIRPLRGTRTEGNPDGRETFTKRELTWRDKVWTEKRARFREGADSPTL